MTPAQFKTARKALGMTQAQIAEFLGVRNTSTIRRWEHGQVPIPQTVGMVFERDSKIAALEAELTRMKDIFKQQQSELEQEMAIAAEAEVHNAAMRQALKGLLAILNPEDEAKYWDAEGHPTNAANQSLKRAEKALATDAGAKVADVVEAARKLWKAQVHVHSRPQDGFVMNRAITHICAAVRALDGSKTDD